MQRKLMEILLGVRENERIEEVAEETMVAITLGTTTQRTSPVETS
jgi:translation initiation factor 2 gamma subunit (eIF-2gamma)